MNSLFFFALISFLIILQEPGILEEPNLTLINTDLSCKVDTTEWQKDLSTSIPSEEPIVQKINCIAGSSQNECKISISPSSQFLDSPDTPSMISFLRHEQSCKQTGNDSGNSYFYFPLIFM